MKKEIITTIAIILAIPFVFGMVAGNNETIEFNGKVSDCYIFDDLGNLSDYNLDGLSFIESENNVIINSNPLLSPSNITISCLVEGFRQEKSSYGGGSSGGSSAPSGWSAKCGYNQECLYGINNTEDIIEEEIIDEPYEPECYECDKYDEIEKNSNISKWIFFGIILIYF